MRTWKYTQNKRSYCFPNNSHVLFFTFFFRKTALWQSSAQTQSAGLGASSCAHNCPRVWADCVVLYVFLQSMLLRQHVGQWSVHVRATCVAPLCRYLNRRRHRENFCVQFRPSSLDGPADHSRQLSARQFNTKNVNNITQHVIAGHNIA